jgi:L-lactate dehydrogenase
MKVALKNDLFVPVSISDIKDLSTLAALDRIFDQTRNAAYEIIQRKKATYYAIGLGLLSIVDAILRDQHTVLTISSPLFGQYGVDGISISMPTIVGRRGIEEVLKLPLS